MRRKGRGTTREQSPSFPSVIDLGAKFPRHRSPRHTRDAGHPHLGGGKLQPLTAVNRAARAVVARALEYLIHMYTISTCGAFENLSSSQHCAILSDRSYTQKEILLPPSLSLQGTPCDCISGLVGELLTCSREVCAQSTGRFDPHVLRFPGNP